MSIKLTETEMQAILLDDSSYINNKGAKLYEDKKFAQSVEYYRLAAAMGSVQSISNLGYCYLYGRDIEQNTSLAIAYFKIAASRKNIDAMYKLGDIYSKNKYVNKDSELSIYYYRMAMSFLIENDLDKYSVYYCDKLEEYPSLCFAYGRELFEGNYMPKDLELSYLFLKHAVNGYEYQIKNGDTFYIECLKDCEKLISNHLFDEYRNKKIDEDNYEYMDEEE